MKELSFNEIVDKIDKIELNGFEAVVGIMAGGIVPASLLAYKLDAPVFFMDINYRNEDNTPKFDEPKLINNFSLNGDIKKVLLVDDVSVTGKTLSLAKDNLSGLQVSTFVLKGKADHVVFPEIMECVNWPWRRLKFQNDKIPKHK